MALFKISKGLNTNLPTTLTEGYCWYTYDDSKFYIDYKDENGVLVRKALNAEDAETLTGASLATILNSSDIEIPTSKAVLDALADYQTKSDDTLATEEKTIIGAINELNNTIGTDGIVGTWVFNDEITTVLDVIDTQEKYDQYDLDLGIPHSLNYTYTAYGQTLTATDISCVFINNVFYETEYQNFTMMGNVENSLGFYTNGVQIIMGEPHSTNHKWYANKTIVVHEETDDEAVKTWLKANAKKQTQTILERLDTLETKPAQTSITYAELKSLRDNSELVPGMFYRIIDYQCTTSQANTRAMNNRFDVIVQALSNNTLSENASADYHYNEDGSVDGYFQFIKSQTTINIEWLFSLGAGGYGDGNNFSFNGLGYEENNEGDTVPVLYHEADFDDKWFYLGTYEFDDEIYDRWRLIEEDTGEDGNYLWDSKFKKYILTNIIVQNNQFTISDVADMEVMYTMYDDDDTTYDGTGNHSDTIIEATYKENNEGVLVPVLYKTKIEEFAEADYNDPIYYIGRYEYNGETYDRWRKVEDQDWSNGHRYYILTNVVIENNQFMDGVIGATTEELVKVVDIPAWELKYCLDNDTTRFAWATISDDKTIYTDDECWFANTGTLEYDGTTYYKWESKSTDWVEEGFEKFLLSTTLDLSIDDSLHYIAYLDGSINDFQNDYSTIQNVSIGGKGIIYYMKDEYNNECPYDFKNIQFSPNGNWLYTFSTENSLAKDSTLDKEFNVYSNISKVCYDTNNPVILTLNRNVFIGNNCYNNTFDNDCYNNIFNSDCYNNTFGNNCYNNTFGNHCSANTFEYNCNSNTFGDDCGSNTFGNNCYSNTFGISKASPIHFVKDIRFNSSCSYIKLLNTETGSHSNCVRDIVVSVGVGGAYQSPLELEVSRNAAPVVFEAAGTTHIILD